MERMSDALDDVKLEMEYKERISKLIEHGYSVYHTKEQSLITAFCHDCYIFFSSCIEDQLFDKLSLDKFVVFYNSGMNFEFAQFYACESINKLSFMMT